jgi:hypothetical protein
MRATTRAAQRADCGRSSVNKGDHAYNTDWNNVAPTVGFAWNSDVVATLHRTAANLRVAIVGYSDMSVEEVARECQVTLLIGEAARIR